MNYQPNKQHPMYLFYPGNTGKAPTVRIEPRYQHVDEGAPVTFQCIADGSPPPSIEWRKCVQFNVLM